MTDVQTQTSIDAEMKVTADSADDDFETVVTKAAKRMAKVAEKTATSKAPKKPATTTAPATRVSSGKSVLSGRGPRVITDDP